MPHQQEDRWLFGAFLGLLLWAPLPLGSNRPWSWSLLCAGICLLAAAWLIQFLRQRVTLTPLFQRALPAIALLAIAQCWVALQLLPFEWASTDPYMTKVRLLQGVAYSLVFCLVLLLVNTRERMRALVYVAVASGVFQATFAGFMLLSGMEHGFFVETHSDRGRATGSFINANHLAGYLEMCLAFGIGLLLADLAHIPSGNRREFWRRTIKTLIGPKTVVRLSLAVMVIALVLSRSRLGNVAFFSSLCGVGLVGLWLQQRLSRNAILFFVSLLVIDLMIVGNWFGIEQLAERLGNTNAAHEQRDEVAGDALQLIEDNWLTGTGAGTFYTNFPRYRGADFRGYNDHAHNDYLEFWSEYGAIGSVPLAALVLWSVALSLRAQRERRDRLAKGIGFAASMAIISLLIHSSGDFNLQIPANAMLFMVALAMAWWSRYFAIKSP
ncbi:MAG: O-antigen ligase [Halieaceae bacterium]